MNCSDYSQAPVCRKCGSIVSTVSSIVNAAGLQRTVTCRECLSGDAIDLVAVPHVFKYLATELMAMNIRMRLEVQ